MLPSREINRPLRVAIIGHSFMGTIHAQAWRTAPRFFDLGVQPVLAVVCGRDEYAATAFATKFGAERVETDWRAVVASADIDVIDICVPGNIHAEIALAALAAGKHVLCEKRLANTIIEAGEMTLAAEAAADLGSKSMVGFNYRRTPALAYARRLVQEGQLGDIRHIRANYLQDWIVDEDFPLVWRLDKTKAGSGALGDLGSHIIDIAQFVSGHTITGVSALMETFVKSRPLAASMHGLSATASAERGAVTVDDATVFLARTDQGAIGTFEATRFATGRKNAMRLEINGSRGSLTFDFESLNELWFYDNDIAAESAGFRRILVTEPGHPYADKWWPAGHGLGYDHTFVHEIADFAQSIARGDAPTPSFREGLQVQQVMAAVEDSALNESRWTTVNTDSEPADLG